jgi:glycosyltransferase involved in cell wall biosynthesis
MRVAIFTDNDFGKVTGVTTTLRAVLAHAPHDIRPRIYTASDTAACRPDYFAVASRGIGLPWYREMKVYLPALGSMRRELERNGVDLFHITTPGPMGLAARHLARALNIPVVGSYHTHLGDYARTLSGSRRLGEALEAYMRWLYADCERLLVPSEATRSVLMSRGYRAPTLGIWSRGIDTRRFRPGLRSRALREAWNVCDGRPAILYAGRLSREKGLDVVPRVHEALARCGFPHRFVFAGDGPMRDELSKISREAVFTGTLSHDHMAVAMASADLFFFPSATDSLGNVVLEAQASGLPVLVTDRGGPRENLLRGVSGHVLPAGDAAAFAACLGDLLTNADRRRRMGAAARSYALTRGWERALDALYGAWREAARGHDATDRPELVTPAEKRDDAA